MSRTPGRTAPIDNAADGSVVSLEEIERHVGRGRCFVPPDVVMLRQTARVLEIMSGGCGVLATLVCVQGVDGARVCQGGDALLAARILRSRAALRGDRAWSTLLGQRIMFRVVYQAADAATSKRGSSTSRRRTLSRKALRVALAAT